MIGGGMEVVQVALAVVARGGLVLVARRGEGTHLAGSWEFPGGKVEEGEDPSVASRRELREETGLVGGVLEPLLVHDFDYPGRPIRLHAYLIRDPDGEVRTDGGRPWRWIATEDLPTLPMPPANGPIVRALGWRLRDPLRHS